MGTAGTSSARRVLFVLAGPDELRVEGGVARAKEPLGRLFLICHESRSSSVGILARLSVCLWRPVSIGVTRTPGESRRCWRWARPWCCSTASMRRVAPMPGAWRRGLVAGFHEQYPLCPLWLTSREVGYAYAEQELKSFAHYRVAPFTRAQQLEFVGLWFGAQFPRPDQARERDDRIQSLLKALDGAAAPIREMAGNPLLLTLMAWVHHDFGRLPHTQASCTTSSSR